MNSPDRPISSINPSVYEKGSLRLAVLHLSCIKNKTIKHIKVILKKSISTYSKGILYTTVFDL